MSRNPQFAQVLSNVGIGGSEIAAANGMHRFKTRFDLWLEKTGRKPPFNGNVYTRMGHLFEPYAQQKYANKTGCDLITPAESMFHPTIPWARATPDGWRANDEGHKAQIKCIGFFIGKDWKREIPIEIEAQLQWELFVAGGHTNDLAILSGTDDILWERFLFGDIEDPHEILDSMKFEIVPVPRNDTDIATLLDGARRFMEMVERDIQPPADHSKACAGYMNGRRGAFTNDKGKEALVQLEYDAYAPIVDELAIAHSDKKKAERRYDTAANAAREAMAIAGANRIKTDDGPIVWSTDKKLLVPRAWSSEESKKS